MPLEVRTDMGCHGNSVCNLCVSPLSPVGASISQSDTSELKFLYEGHEDFSVIPSYAVIPAQVHTSSLSLPSSSPFTSL